MLIFLMAWNKETWMLFIWKSDNFGLEFEGLYIYRSEEGWIATVILLKIYFNNKYSISKTTDEKCFLISLKRNDLF